MRSGCTSLREKRLPPEGEIDATRCQLWRNVLWNEIVLVVYHIGATSLLGKNKNRVIFLFRLYRMLILSSLTIIIYSVITKSGENVV